MRGSGARRVGNYKEGRALRTETVINDTYDFDVGRWLRNLDDLKQIGFAANRRLLGVQRLSHDATIGAETLAALHRPAHIDGQRASALRFGDPRVQALLRFDLLPAGFRNRELREAVAPLRGMSFDDYNAGQITYDLRRLRLRGLIERIPHSQRYRLTAEGLCIALAHHRTPARVLGPVLSATLDGESTTCSRSGRSRPSATPPPVARCPRSAAERCAPGGSHAPASSTLRPDVPALVSPRGSPPIPRSDVPSHPSRQQRVTQTVRLCKGIYRAGH